MAAALALSSGVNMAAEPIYGLVIHGGAGTIERENLTAETEAAIR